MQGALVCPAEARPERWQAFTFPCTTSEQTMLALMDIYTAFLGTLPVGAQQGQHAQQPQSSAAATWAPCTIALLCADRG